LALKNTTDRNTNMNLLFKYFPSLKSSLKLLSLGEFPTPVEPLSKLSSLLKRDNLFIKRDDLTGQLYGGNKIRKLEFLLGQAKRLGACRVITSGGAGSNHALATAIYAKQVGLKSTIMLFEQSSSPEVKKNLIADYLAVAEMCHDSSYEAHLYSLKAKIRFYEEKEGCAPYLIPPGGSCALGCVGYVDAAFELFEQIKAGIIPEPDKIYIPSGTMGTVAGLYTGLRACKLKTKIIGVRVVPSYVSDLNTFTNLVKSTSILLHDLDKSFPVINEIDNFTISDDYLGAGYGITTEKSADAIRLFEENGGYHLDGVYSGKAAAAFIDAAVSEHNKDKAILFWDTKNSREFSTEVDLIDYKVLPQDFHHYFV
jgi:1-aminocyclopropane-1-carboxylate deaminase/D-cysteine desulfhydrase-like pyridoxal-dependent ACC family enzyme